MKLFREGKERNDTPVEDSSMLDWLKGIGGATAILAIGGALLYSAGLGGLLLRASSQNLPLAPVIYGQLPRDSVLSIGAFVLFPSIVLTIALVAIYRKARKKFKEDKSKAEKLEWFRKWIVIAFLASTVGMLALVSEVFPYDKALVCVDGNQLDASGLLIGQTDKWVYLGEDVSEGDRRILTVPLSRVQAIYAGPEAHAFECDPNKPVEES